MPFSSLCFLISTPSGLFEPTVWSAARCKITKSKITIGTATICNAKNLVNVGSEIAKSPLIQTPSSGPINGIVVKSHGSADSFSYSNAIQTAYYESKNNLLDNIKEFTKKELND